MKNKHLKLKRWLCDGCGTRYEKKLDAKNCVERHNNAWVKSVLKAGTTITYTK
ncbi:hypothetical protein M0R04_12520 [Candidatus Dojkabacteria bacterium]|jgi:hypothetical protein|nr:hypothetical protein [Candidatus Dojkabacteria bacterium]